MQAIAIALAASLMTYVIMRQGGRGPVVIAVLVASALFLLLGQAVPRAGAHETERHRRSAVDPGSVRGDARSPAVRPLRRRGRPLPELFGGEHPDTVPAGSEDELLFITRDDHDDGVIEPEERKMIDNVLRLEETTARDIMVLASTSSPSPRTLVAGHRRRDHGEGHSRLPVFRSRSMRSWGSSTPRISCRS